MNHTMLLGHYDWRLVTLSLAIAICSSYCALDLAGRTLHARGRHRAGWLGCGAITLGLGIWAMHYVGMLAFALPVPVFYNLPIVGLSLLSAILSSFIALLAVSEPKLTLGRWLSGAFCMGMGISVMHYAGMSAIRLAAQPSYDPLLVSAFLIIAFAVSLAALQIAFRFRKSSQTRIVVKLLAALLMGAAIASMHYTGMAAVCFRSHGDPGQRFADAVSVSSLGIFAISATTFFVLALALAGSLADRRFSKQRALLRSEQERWALVLEATHDGLFDADLSTGTVFESAQWQKILGFGPGELPVTSAAWRARIHPDDRQRVEGELAAYLQRSIPKLELEYRLAHRDGSWRWLLLRAQAVWDSTGTPVRLIGSHSDLTERNESEARLRAAEARYREQLESLVEQRTLELKTSESRWRSLVEAAPHMVWSSTPDGKCQFVSQQRVEYTGVPFEEQIGDGWLQLLHPEDRPRTAQLWEAAVAACTAYEAEYRIRSREGHYRWFLSRGIPVRNASGEIESWIGMCSDIDDQKRSEERLEAAVVERTAELAIERDRAQSAARAKSDFLAAMSHEIRTPLNGILGLTSLVLDTRLDSEQQSYLDGIRSSGQSLLGIINDVLDFSKIEAGKLEVETAQFDLQTLVEETFDVLSYSAATKKLQLSFAIDSGVPLDVLGDSGRLRQILLNLLSNAVKFTERGSVTLSISLKGMKGSVPLVRFAVQDTGIGMTCEQQNLIFQPFTQADRSTTRRFGGTGLGLSIAKRLTDLMDGRIGFESTLGFGSTFWFELPLKPDQEHRWEDLANGTAWLLAGDELPLSANQLAYLQRHGMHVMAVAPAAFSSSGETLPDVLLVDSADAVACNTLASLPASHPLCEPPLVVLGNSQSFAAREIPSHFQACAYVPKPVRRVPLLASVASGLAGHRAPIPFQAHRIPAKVVPIRRVLVAEDNRINQIVIRKLLEGLGHAVDIVPDGAHACAAAAKNRFDLILMDCQMPEMDGFEATRRIRAMEAGHSHVPIVALTASVLSEDRELCFIAGMDDFLAKPISKPALQAALDRCFRERSAA